MSPPQCLAGGGPGGGRLLNARRGDGINDGDGDGASGQNGTIRPAGEGWGVQSGLDAGQINADGAEGGSEEWEKGPKGLKQPPWESGRLASRPALLTQGGPRRPFVIRS